MSNDLFKNIEKKSGVNMQEVFKFAESIKGANFRDEKTVREIIQEVGKLANKKVPKEQEDQLVHAIVNDPKSINFGTIAKMLEKNKKK
ncbi:stage VI sporulation protein F [Evansella sp. AB-P1]|uniref:stage VI sporulation protein F n=1 Tax=Evansella sp. AB-P1 TaxID=3037653 RepID=UPI0024201FA4|nr:stage VI sporulation protein F [Evansella sp. AB-P1]MDG5788445.1 stage VI sporulation protein F [Evansella sp. AB-P1]